MSLSLSSLSAGSAAGAARSTSPLTESLQRLSSALKIARGEDSSASLVSAETQRAQVAGMGAAIDELSKATDPTSAEEAWARIDALLNQVRQLALDSADSSATSSSTTAQAISAYAQHSESANVPA